jgi:hypothetical protein
MDLKRLLNTLLQGNGDESNHSKSGKPANKEMLICQYWEMCRAEYVKNG